MKVNYINLRHNQLSLNQRVFSKLKVMIVHVQPIRKLFWQGSLVCHSYDTEQAVNGRSCIFCPDKHDCQQKTSLTMLVAGKEEKVAIIDLNLLSQTNFELLIKELGRDKLNRTVVEISVQNIDGRLAVRFTAVPPQE